MFIQASGYQPVRNKLNDICFTVDTKVPGAASAKREAVQAAQGSKGDTSKKIVQPMLQAAETEKVTGNEECSEWFDEEMRVLQVD